MQDPDGSVPFFWGVDSEGHLVVSDDVESVKKGCGKSFASFPKGTLKSYNSLSFVFSFSFLFSSLSIHALNLYNVLISFGKDMGFDP